MDLDPELLEVLACPQCKGQVTAAEHEEALDCANCGLRFRVDDGIPVMLVAEALPAP
ncbi:MAG: Trm112 family protein [Candidatus Dormibacteria bacterium]